MDEIRIVGTSHISSQSLQDIKHHFLDFKPDIIGVELDKGRLAGMLGGEQKLGLSAVRQLGVRGYLFVVIGRYVQQRLGRMVGMKPGSEMLFAVKLAKNNKLVLALIDKQMDKVVRRMFKKFSFKEFMTLVGDVFGSFFQPKRKRVAFDISKVPQEEVIEKLLLDVKKKYPSVYHVLIDERNHYMARQLVLLHKKNPGKKILAVVGAGHKKEMEKLLAIYNSKIEMVR